MKPYRKKYSSKKYSEVLGWRQSETMKHLVSPLNISKPFRVNSLAEFNLTPKYPECSLEPPWLPMLSPRPQYSLLPHKQFQKFNRPLDDHENILYPNKVPASLHRPNVYSMSTRSNDSGGYFHSYKGSVDFPKHDKKTDECKNANVESGEYSFSDEELDSEQNIGENNDKGSKRKLNKDRLVLKKNRVLGEEQKFSENKNRVLEDREPKIRNRVLKDKHKGGENKNRVLEDGDECEDNQRDLELGFSGNNIERFEKIKGNQKINKNLKNWKGSDECDAFENIEFHLGQKNLEGSKLQNNKLNIPFKSEGINYLNSDTEESDKLNLPNIQQKNKFEQEYKITETGPKIRTADNSHPKFQKTPLTKKPQLNLNEKIPRTIYSHNKTKSEPFSSIKPFEYSQILNLSPILEAPLPNESEKPSTSLSRNDLKTQEKNPEKLKITPFSSRNPSQKNTQKEKKKTLTNSEYRKQNSIPREIQNFTGKTETQKESEPKSDRPVLSTQYKQSEKSENSPTVARQNLPKQATIKNPQEHITKRMSIRINIVPPTKGKRKKTKLRRTSSLLSSKSTNFLNPQLLKRRPKRTSTIGEISISDALNTSRTFLYSSSVDRFINNYSLSFVSMLSILLVNLKENINEINKEVPNSDRQEFNTVSIIRKNKKMKSKNINKRMKIELSVVMKPMKRQSKLDSGQIIENIKKSIFSDGVKNDLIQYIRNRKSTINSLTAKKNMRKIISRRLKNNNSDVQFISKSYNSEDSSDSENAKSEGSSSEDSPKNPGMLKPDYKKKNLEKFLSDLNQRRPNSPESPGTNYSSKQIKIQQRDLQDSDIEDIPEQNLYIYNENNCDISEELEKMAWCNMKNLQKFMFSSQIQHSYLANKVKNDVNDFETNDYEDGLDLLNLEYRMLKKRFYDMKGIKNLEGDEPNYNLIILNSDDFSSAESKKFDIEKVRKYLKFLKYQQNRPKICIKKAKGRTFSNLIK